jgi:hypothetical protein
MAFLSCRDRILDRYFWSYFSHTQVVTSVYNARSVGHAACTNPPRLTATLTPYLRLTMIPGFLLSSPCGFRFLKLDLLFSSTSFLILPPLCHSPYMAHMSPLPSRSPLASLVFHNVVDWLRPSLRKINDPSLSSGNDQ